MTLFDYVCMYLSCLYILFIILIHVSIYPSMKISFGIFDASIQFTLSNLFHPTLPNPILFVLSYRSMLLPMTGMWTSRLQVEMRLKSWLHLPG